ncbi:MAG: hypothetical protein M1812_003972 [Candelaria pacifica]|nr:MAG: hypothetical protein M1812_003972 [Candelaria pacifica]
MASMGPPPNPQYILGPLDPQYQHSLSIPPGYYPVFPAIHAALQNLSSAVASGDISQVCVLVTSNKASVESEGVTSSSTRMRDPKAHIHEINVPITQYATNGLRTAIHRDQPEIVRYLLDNGADIQDQSVLSSTMFCRSVEIFETLIEKGWDINTFPILGSMLKDPELVKWFLAHGADPNIGEPGEILNTAASASSVATFKTLLQHGTDISQSLSLHNAAGAKEDISRIPMLTFLVDELGLDVNASDEMRGPNGRVGAPLHYAIRTGGLEKVRFLVERGASLVEKNEINAIALEEAEKTCYWKVIEFFRGLNDCEGRKDII